MQRGVPLMLAVSLQGFRCRNKALQPAESASIYHFATNAARLEGANGVRDNAMKKGPTWHVGTRVWV